MFNNIKISGLLKGLRPNRGSFDHRTLHPVREWMIGLAIAFSIIIGGGVQSALMFVQYRNISTTETGIFDDTAIKYNRNLVERSIEAFRVKKEAYEKYQREMPAEVMTTPVSAAEEATSSDVVATSSEETTDEEVPFEEAVIVN